MNALRFISILLALTMISCHRSDKPSGATSPRTNKPESKKETMTVTIDGQEAMPEEKRAFKQLLSQAISKAVSEGAQELLEKLEITDPVEVELMSVSFDSKASDAEVLWSMYFIRPGKEMKEPRTIVLSRDGKPVIRYSRAIVPAQWPMAIMSRTTTKNGRLTQEETFLVYTDGKWKQYRPSEHNKRMD